MSLKALVQLHWLHLSWNSIKEGSTESAQPSVDAAEACPSWLTTCSKMGFLVWVGGSNSHSSLGGLADRLFWQATHSKIVQLHY